MIKDAPATLDNNQFYGIHLDDEQRAFRDAVWNKDIDIVFVNSRAGTGKTTVATGVANLLVQYGRYDGIVYIMSPYGERKQGWLPGTLTEKSSVYFEAFYQALVECGINPNTAINDEKISQAMQMAQAVRECISLVEKEVGKPIDIMSLSYNRLMNHVRNMVARAMSKEQLKLNMNDYMSVKFPKAFETARYICEQVGRSLKCTLSDVEIGYLAMHIERVACDELENKE